MAIFLLLMSFVTGDLGRGQLGNQMHTIATTLAYAWDHGYEALFPQLYREDFNIPMNRERIFFRLNASPLPREVSYVHDYWHNFVYSPIPDHPDMMLNGLFQTWEYFHHHRDKLIDIFAPSQEEYQKLITKHASLLSHPCTVAVHVRTFSKECSDAIIPFVGMDYYKLAFNYFPKDAQFVIFSDRINWCKHHFSKFNRKIVYIENQDHIEDFFLMTMLKHQIIANSSFSWWAAYLNKNPNKIVIAPSHFLRPQSYLLPVYHANLPDWKVLNIELSHRKNPYPPDIKFYDRQSQSLDTQ